jgi:hypothetical protein
MIWGEPPEHKADHSEADKGGCGSGIALEIAGQTAIAADPSQSSLDQPSLWQDSKSLGFVGSFDDLDFPVAGFCSSCPNARPLIACVGVDTFDEGKQSPGTLVENQGNTVAILDAGGMNSDVQQEAKRIDEDVPLAALDLFARVEA